MGFNFYVVNSLNVQNVLNAYTIKGLSPSSRDSHFPSTGVTSLKHLLGSRALAR
jgi:hypothetical protein